LQATSWSATTSAPSSLVSTTWFACRAVTGSATAAATTASARDARPDAPELVFPHPASVIHVGTAIDLALSNLHHNPMALDLGNVVGRSPAQLDACCTATDKRLTALAPSGGASSATSGACTWVRSP
jgi:hypothetical protein